MTNADIIATIAAFFTMIGYVPQALKTIKTRDTKSLSFWMYFLSMIGVIFWLAFGIMIGNVPIIFKNVTLIILGGIILWIKTTNIFKNEEESFVKSEKFKKFRNFFRKKF
ncbi:MAG: SemiSWEET family transporter [Rickettsiales bacterium]|nr:SemiSWEET family transporter [Rickettsiales bacterium]